ncbi:MAG: alpha-L-arabinofuranosidase C-terminal domain-containing protein, partial [Thermodesulfobacteriota bacterium]
TGLHEYFRNSDIYFMANYAQTVNVIGAIKTSRTASILDTTGVTLKLYRQHFGQIPVEVKASNIAPLDVSAALKNDRRAITIAVVNPTDKQRDLPLVLKGIKDDEVAVQSIGKNVTLHKIVAFAVAAGLAAVAGSLIAAYISYISPGYFDLHMSVFVVIALIFGGVGRIPGAALGAMVLTALPELLRFIPYLPSTILGGTRDLIYATILVFFMLYRPQGLMGKARQ